MFNNNSILAHYENGNHSLIKEQIRAFCEIRIALDIFGIGNSDYKTQLNAILSAEKGFFANELEVKADKFLANYKRIIYKLEKFENFDFSRARNLDDILNIYAKMFFWHSARDFLSSEPKGYTTSKAV